MKISRGVWAASALSLIGAFVGCAPRRSQAADVTPNAQPPGDARPAAGTETALYASAERLPERAAPDGTTIVVGNPGARSTVHVYEDPRCPVVEEYERTGAEALQKLLLMGEIKAEYTFASFKDDRLGGDGSKRAVNALRAALEKGKFVEYHAVLFENQAAVESSSGFTTERLLKLAEKVPGLRGEAFDLAVRTTKYSSFVTASQQAYQETGDDPIGPGTPTIVVNGHNIDGGLYGFNFDATVFRLLVTDLHKHPATWEALYQPLKEKAAAEAAAS
ncbi:DsbA family protein [Streptomyces sp. NRRL S-118]|uniref:DsbA family protein n=1 Tax=Streptomyces sp. NRRL S-118 TaxID=1463881 RepID=UPI0004C8C605|nr:thioredoxin domain-containing protein [Streptomyces sp. NRRL S-118]